MLENKKIVLLKRQQPGVAEFISLPGGQVDNNEAIFKAAERELAEESGLSSEEWQLMFSSQRSSKIDWIVFVFIAKNCKYTTQPSPDAGELIERVDCTFDEFVDISQQDNFRDEELKSYILKARINPEMMDYLRLKLFSK